MWRSYQSSNVGSISGDSSYYFGQWSSDEACDFEESNRYRPYRHHGMNASTDIGNKELPTIIGKLHTLDPTLCNNFDYEYITYISIRYLIDKLMGHFKFT